MTAPGGRIGRAAGALGRMRSAVRADYDAQCGFDARYDVRGDVRPSLGADVFRRVGLQLSVAYRVMRFFDEAGAPLAAQVMSRLIRHAYGADIHWKAQIEPGVMIVHGMGLAVSHLARVGRGALVFQNVTLGAGLHPETREAGAPTIEENVHIGPGAAILGPVTIGAGSKIMANCVVTTSVPPDSIVEAPAPEVRPRTRGRQAGLAGPQCRP